MKNYHAILVSYTNKKHKTSFIEKTFRDLKKNEILVKIKFSCINYKDALFKRDGKCTFQRIKSHMR